MPEQRNLILAIVLSVTIILAFQYFYELPRMKETQHQPAQRTEQTTPSPQPAQRQAGAPAAPAAPASVTPGVEAVPPGQTRAGVLASSKRLPIQGDRVHGTLPLAGGRIDDVVLSDYHVTTAPDSPDVTLLNPPGAPDTYFAEFGWVPADKSVAVPGRDTVWQPEGGELRTGQPVAFSWDNGQGLRFHRQVAVDDAFMFTITQRVENTGQQPVTLMPYGLISRWSVPQTRHYYILHEGPIGVLGGKLHEIDYKDLVKDGDVQLQSQGGWLGITDKYWLVALVPDQGSDITGTFRAVKADDQEHYQVDYLRPAMTIAPGQSVEVTERLFAGAKEVKLLDRYREALNIPLFDRAVDFGWFYFLTKPLFLVLHFFHGIVGNYGVAILLLTLLVKLLFFPLANKSYTSMSKMKKLQPEMTKLRELYGDDKARLNQELMNLYKTQKVNPMSGCLPIVVQIPVFFSLYKVLFVSIEMRHAPFFGWIHDLSAPDPTTVFNLFGLIPWHPPAMLAIGIWPLIMGMTMLLQQRLNPQPADPMQAKVMMFLPVMFTFLFATFPAGLVIYWTWNNTLSIAQQWVIMKRMGVKA
jgi:YidC/Oxa1 family membrane protein insertase